MDWKKIADKAKNVVDERGGVEALKQDAAELKNIVRGDGSLADKAKEAAAAIKDPGAAGDKPAAHPHT